MEQFRALDRSVTEVIRQGRIGAAVSLRLVDHTTADHGRIEPILARGIQTACTWLGRTPEHVSAAGGIQAGQITALLRFAAGQSALVSAGVYGLSPPRLEALVVGNRGISRWEPPESIELEDVSTRARMPDADPPLPVPVQEVMKTIRAALAQGQDVPLNGPTERKRGAIAPSAQATREARFQVVPSVQPAANRMRVPGPRPPFGVLLIAGGATHQEDYARALSADPRCRLVGLVDESDIPPRRRHWNERLAGELRIPVLPDLNGALAREDVQIVSICAEPERRGRIILRCAEAGKHLYLDKPLAASDTEVRQVVAAIQRAGVVNQMFSQVHTAMATRARQLVRSGRLGEVRAIHVDLLFAKGSGGTSRLGTPRVETHRPAWFERPDSKRELYNIGVYPLVFIRWLLERPVRRVSAITANYFFREHQQNNMEDFGLMLLELDGGITASVMVGRTGWRSHPLGGVNRAVLVGTKAMACVDADRPRLEVWADEPHWLPPRPDLEDPMGFWRSTPSRLGLPPKRGWISPEIDPPSLADARFFLDCLEQGRSSEVDAVAGAAAVEVLMAAYESAATGQPVRLSAHTP